MKRALVIGINDYGPNNSLAGCLNDVNDWAKVFKIREFDEINIIIDKQATGNAILSAVDRLIGLSKKGDTLVIQYSGHGSFIRDENNDEDDSVDECLCPYDIMDNGPIVDDQIYELSQQIKPGVRALMISDSCHSGTVAKFAPIMTPPSTKNVNSPQRTIRFMPPSNFLSKKEISKLSDNKKYSPISRGGYLLLMAGCQDWEYSYDAYFNGRPNGAFSFVAIESLSKISTKATYIQWINAIRKMLPSRQYPQTPNLFGFSNIKRRIIL